MIKVIKSKLSSLYALALTVVALGATKVAYGAQTYDFSSSTDEAGAFVSELASTGFTLILASLAGLLGLALTIMGIAWVWGRFKKFSGMGKKI